MNGWVLGIDVGGTGSRVAIRRVGSAERWERSGEVVAVTATGSSAPQVAQSLIEGAAAAWPAEFRELVAVGAGVSGLASLVEHPDELPGTLGHAVANAGGPSRVPMAVAIDAVTSHLGALGGRPGVVTALGTGAISLSTDGATGWRRADGWGHVLGDRGGGAWIGMQALSLALQAYDGIDDRGARLLTELRSRLGEPGTWPGQIYTRADRAAVLAGVTHDVAKLARLGDERSAEILRQAGALAAQGALAARGNDVPPRFALIGGLCSAVPEIRAAFDEALSERCANAEIADIEIVVSQGDALDGALLLAERAAEQPITTCAPFVWTGETRG